MARIWTASLRGITPGIPSRDGIITLGETGRARRLVTVTSAVGDAHTATVIRGRSGDVSLLPGCDIDADVVRVNTNVIYTRGCPGWIDILSGWTMLLEGRSAWGDAGNLGFMPDSLLAARGDAVARVVFSGGRSKGAGVRYLCRVSGKVVLFDLGPDPRPDQAPSACLSSEEGETIAHLMGGCDYPEAAELAAELLSHWGHAPETF